jgi:hypothetical protein
MSSAPLSAMMRTAKRGNEFFIKLALAYEATTQCSRTDRKPRSAHVTVLSALLGLCLGRHCPAPQPPPPPWGGVCPEGGISPAPSIGRCAEGAGGGGALCHLMWLGLGLQEGGGGWGWALRIAQSTGLI